MKRAVIGLLLGLGLLGLSGCFGSGSNIPELPNPSVRFFNSSPNSVGLLYKLNFQTMAGPLAYLASSSNFITVEPDDYDISIEEASDPTTQDILADLLERDKDYIVVSVGLVTPPNTEFEKRMQVFIREISRDAPNGNKSRIYIVHAYHRAPGLMTPAIDFQNPGDNPQFVTTNIEYGNGAELTIDSGTQTFVARRNQTEAEITPQITFTFEPGRIYLALVTGIEDSVATPPVISITEIQSE